MSHPGFEKGHQPGQCQFDVAHGPTCYCHRPGTVKFKYGVKSDTRLLCPNHWNHEDMRLHHRAQFAAYLASNIMDAVKFRKSKQCPKSPKRA